LPESPYKIFKIITTQLLIITCIVPNMSLTDNIVIVPSTTTDKVVTTTTSTVASKKPRTIVIPDKYMGLNQVLAKLHHSLLPMCGRVFVSCPNLVCFPKNTPDGIRKARELGEKWSDSFHNRRWNDDFKLAGLWVRFFFDIENRMIKVTVEPKRAPHVAQSSTVDPVIDTSVHDVLNDGFIEPDDEFADESTVTESETGFNAEYTDSYADESTGDYADSQMYFRLLSPIINGWTMTPYGWMIAQQPWVPFGWGFGRSPMDFS